MRPFLVPIEVETEMKKCLELNNALHFAELQVLRAPDYYPASNMNSE